jgi:hypothetical protein
MGVFDKKDDDKRETDQSPKATEPQSQNDQENPKNESGSEDEATVEERNPDEAAVDNDGFLGTDPVYQNAATHHFAPGGEDLDDGDDESNEG